MAKGYMDVEALCLVQKLWLLQLIVSQLTEHLELLLVNMIGQNVRALSNLEG